MQLHLNLSFQGNKTVHNNAKKINVTLLLSTNFSRKVLIFLLVVSEALVAKVPRNIFGLLNNSP